MAVRGTNQSGEVTRAALPAEADAETTTEASRRGPKKGGRKRKRAKGGVSKSHAVAICVEKLGHDATPQDIAKMLLEEFKIDLKNTNISQYKSIYLRRLREGGDVATMDGAPAVATAPAPRARSREDGETVTLGEVRQLKELLARLGEKGFRALIELILA